MTCLWYFNFFQISFEVADEQECQVNFLRENKIITIEAEEFL